MGIVSLWFLHSSQTQRQNKTSCPPLLPLPLFYHLLLHSLLRGIIHRLFKALPDHFHSDQGQVENWWYMQDHKPSFDPLFALAQRKEEQKGSDHRRQTLPRRCRNSVSLMLNHNKFTMEGNLPLAMQIRRQLALAHHRRWQIPPWFRGPNPKQHNLSPFERSKMVILSILAGLHKQIREGSHWRMIIITLPLFKYEDKEKTIA